MTREQLEDVVAGMSDAIKRQLQKMAGGEVGFCLMIFDYGEKGSFAYGANARRGDVVALLEEAIEKIRGVQ